MFFLWGKNNACKDYCFKEWWFGPKKMKEEHFNRYFMITFYTRGIPQASNIKHLLLLIEIFFHAYSQKSLK